MHKQLIVLENMADWAPYFPSSQVISADDYLRNPPLNRGQRAQVINLCNNLSYLSPGYYSSMLAEARDHRVMPSLRTINDLSRKSLYVYDLSAFSPQLNKLHKGDSGNRFRLKIFFGQCAEPSLQKLARQLFERYPCPILEVDFSYKDQWLISRLRAGSISQLAESEQDTFANALDSFSHTLWRKPARRRQYRFDLAILHDPDETMPPSDKRALKNFISSGRRLGIDVELITQRDYLRLAEYDALFIRETTAIDHHTYKFARRAEREGLVVIDDPTSIIRCTNKIYLKELLEQHQLPMPTSHLLYKGDKAGLARLAELAEYPLVMKIPDGAFSRGVIKVNNAEELRLHAQDFFRESAIILLQEFMFTDYDWRIGVLGGKPLYACQYFMSQGHWQIYNHQAKNGVDSGQSTAFSLSDVPAKVIKLATKAARLVGDGLYGIDIKQSGSRVVIIEINDNPSIDSGVEDAWLGAALYDDIMREFLRRLEQRSQPRPY